MNSDFGFENRKAFLERSRDERILSNPNKDVLSKQLSKTEQIIANYHKQERFDNNVKMSGMHKENFNMNFNKKI